MFIISGLRVHAEMHESLLFGSRKGVLGIAAFKRSLTLGFRGDALEGYNPVNAISPEDAELAFAIAAKVNQSAATLARAG